MEFYQLVIQLIKYPIEQSSYEDLSNYYHQKGLDNESKAFDNIIEKRFNKNVANNHTNNNK